MTTLSPIRIGRVTASRVPGILGIGYNTPDETLAAMVRESRGEPGILPTIAMQHGKHYEPHALAAYERATGLLTYHSDTQQITVIHPEHTWIAVTPDAWVGTAGLVEIKCPYNARYTTVQPEHYAQIQTQLAATGQDYCDWVCYRPGEPPIIETVPADLGWLEEKLPLLKAFHDRYLKAVLA